MIDSIEIRNFQSHKNTVINLDPGLNVITGSSDRGKSAIIKAINWVLTNRPQGEPFRRWGSGDAPIEVTLNFDDGSFVTRRRGKGVNEYETDEDKHKALRTDVPTEVKKIANIPPCCFQRQAEPYFLIQNSAGEVAKELNSIVGLEIIEKTIKGVNAINRDSKRKVDDCEASIASIRVDLEKYTDLKTITKKFKTLKAMSAKADELEEDIETLSDTLHTVQVLESKKDVLLQLVGMEDDVAHVKGLLASHDTVKEQALKLDSLIKSIQNIVDKISILKKQLGKTGSFDKLYNDVVAQTTMEEQFEHLSDTINNIKTMKSKISDARNIVSKAKKEHKAFLRKAGVCPTCGRKF